MADETPSKESIAAMAKVMGMDLSDKDLEAILPLVRDQLRQAQVIRGLKIDRSVEPDAIFIAEG